MSLRGLALSTRHLFVDMLLSRFLTREILCGFDFCCTGASICLTYLFFVASRFAESSVLLSGCQHHCVRLVPLVNRFMRAVAVVFVVQS